MKHHWMYLKYVLRHKWYVYQEGRKLNLPRWQLICHDLSKFLPDEWFPYARYFYGGPYRPWAEWTIPDKEHLDWKWSQESICAAFDAAWLRHQRRNPHHWQHWVLRNDDGTTRCLPIPWHQMLEMLADWAGAGKAINGRQDVFEWYDRNRLSIQMDAETRSTLEGMISAVYGDGVPNRVKRFHEWLPGHTGLANVEQQTESTSP